MKRLRYALLILFCCVACLTCPKDNETPAWENLSQSAGDSFTPTVATDDDGNVYVVWADTSSGNIEILFVEKTMTGVWSQPLNISNSTSMDVVPFIDVDSRGGLHVCWWGIEFDMPDTRIMYRHRDASGMWGTIQILAQAETGQSAHNLPRIVVDANDNVFVFWETVGTLRYVTKSLTGNWSDTMTVPTATSGNPPELAADESGNIHLVWEDGSSNIEYQQRTSGGSWQNWETVDDGVVPPLGYDITADGTDNVYITWDNNYGSNGRYVYYATDRSGAWAGRVELPKVRESDEGAQSSCVASDDGTLHLIWRNWRRDTTGYVPAEIYYVKQYPDGTWGNIHNVSNTASESRCGVRGITVDGFGNIHIVWSDHEPGNYDILYIMIPADSLD